MRPCPIGEPLAIAGVPDPFALERHPALVPPPLGGWAQYRRQAAPIQISSAWASKTLHDSRYGAAGTRSRDHLPTLKMTEFERCQYRLRRCARFLRRAMSVGEIITVAGAVAAAFMWVLSSLRHRSHLSQCAQDLHRQQRLDRRLRGCVAEIEHILDGMPAQAPGEVVVPEELVGHVRYLSGLRQEAQDNAFNLARHAVRLQWPDAYVSKATTAARRCEIAHGALVTAFRALADAAREYERGLPMALVKSGDGPEARNLTAPVRLLDEEAASEVAHLREGCREALTTAAEACGLRFNSSALFDTKWPVRRSEIPPKREDVFRGEVRPMGWDGLGSQPLLHVDAK